jgi:transaldolase
MEQHAVLITTFIKRVIDSNLKKINTDHMKYDDVIMGAKIIWKKY